MRTPRYWLRRAVVIIGHWDNMACRLHGCPEPFVGYSVWCREHTDQILEHREESALVAQLERMGFR